MTRRSLALLLCLGALAIAACAPVQPVPSADSIDQSADPARVGFGALEFERAIYEPLIARFNAENPAIRVEFVPIEGVFGSGGPAEVARNLAATADSVALPLLPNNDVGAGLFADLRPLIAADPTFDQGDYYPAALAPAADGKIYRLGHTLSVQSISYNADLWAAAGLAAPAVGWSWGDLLAAAEQLTRRDGDETLVYGFDDGQNGALLLQGLLAEAGVSLAPAADGALSIDSPATEATLDRLADLVERGVVKAQAAGGVGFSAPFGDRAAGRVGLWLGPAAFGGPLEAGPGFAVGSASVPSLGRQSLIGQRGYALSAGSANPEAAWRWLAFLSQQQIAGPPGLVFIGGGTDVPARRSLAESAGTFAGQPPDLAAALQAALEAYDRAPEVDPAVHEALGALAGAIAEGRRPAEALPTADADLQQRLAERAAAAEQTPEPVAVQLPEPTVAPSGATPLRFGGFGIEPARLRQLAETFNASGSGHYVQIQPPTFGMAEEPSLASVAAANDCFLWPRPPNADEAEHLLDLQPLLDADTGGGTPLRDDYPAGLLAPYRDNGRLLGLPYAIDLPAMSYNRDLFDAQGLDYPQAGWGYAELLAAAARLTATDGPDPRYGYAATGSLAADLLAFLDWRGATLTTGAGDDLRPAFDDPGVAQVIGDYLELLRAASPHTSLDGYRSDGDFDPSPFGLTQSGKVGMWYSYSGAGIVIRIAGPGSQPPDIAIAPPLAGANGPSLADITSRAVLISAQSANPAGCWEWLKFLSAQTGILEDSFPARSSVARSPEFLDGARPGSAEVYAAYRPALAAPAGADPLAELDLFWLFQAADRALQGADLDAELASAQLLSEQYLLCVRGGEEPATCASSVDSDYAGIGPGRP